MSFEEELSRKRDTPIAIFHRFRTGVNQKNILHLFVEGYEDAFFYEKHILLESRDNVDKWRSYICLGKKNMDSVVKLFNKSPFIGRNVLFVRDSDYDLFLQKLPESDHLVFTSGYSVENYVCDCAAVRNYIIAGLGVDREEAKVDAIIAEHEDAVSRTFAFLADFIGACLMAMKQGVVLDLDKFDIKIWYHHFYVGGDLEGDALHRHAKLCGLTEDHFNIESQALGRDYVRQDAFKWTRGKFLLKCTCALLKIVHERLRVMHKAREISRFNRFSSNDFREKAVFERLSGFIDLNDEVGVRIRAGVKAA